MDAELQGSYAYTDPLKGVYYGPGCLSSALPKLLDAVGAKTTLIVTGRSLHTKVRVTYSFPFFDTHHAPIQTDVVRKVEEVLKARNAYGATFWEIGEHSPVAGINAGIEELARVGADVIVSVGGGSPIDASKAIIYRHHEKRTDAKFIPQIAVPTTLSAAEYTVRYSR